MRQCLVTAVHLWIRVPVNIPFQQLSVKQRQFRGLFHAEMWQRTRKTVTSDLPKDDEHGMRQIVEIVIPGYLAWICMLLDVL